MGDKKITLLPARQETHEIHVVPEKELQHKHIRSDMCPCEPEAKDLCEFEGIEVDEDEIDVQHIVYVHNMLH